MPTCIALDRQSFALYFSRYSSRGQQYNSSYFSESVTVEGSCRAGARVILTIFCRKDFLICDQFLTKTHYKVDVLWSSALRLLPPLVIPVVYSRKRETNKTSCFHSLLLCTHSKITSVRKNDIITAVKCHHECVI